MLLRDVRSLSSNSSWNVLEVEKQNAVGAEFAGSTRKISRTPRFTLRPLRSAFEFVLGNAVGSGLVCAGAVGVSIGV